MELTLHTPVKANMTAMEGEQLTDDEILAQTSSVPPVQRHIQLLTRSL